MDVPFKSSWLEGKENLAVYRMARSRSWVSDAVAWCRFNNLILLGPTIDRLDYGLRTSGLAIQDDGLSVGCS
jgi:hypothetical protein